MFAFLKSCINFEGPRRFKSSILPNENQYLPCENNGLGMFDFVGPTNRKCKQREIITYTHIYIVSRARARSGEREKSVFLYAPVPRRSNSARRQRRKSCFLFQYTHTHRFIHGWLYDESKIVFILSARKL